VFGYYRTPIACTVCSNSLSSQYITRTGGSNGQVIRRPVNSLNNDIALFVVVPQTTTAISSLPPVDTRCSLFAHPLLYVCVCSPPAAGLSPRPRGPLLPLPDLTPAPPPLSPLQHSPSSSQVAPRSGPLPVRPSSRSGPPPVRPSPGQALPSVRFRCFYLPSAPGGAGAWTHAHARRAPVPRDCENRIFHDDFSLSLSTAGEALGARARTPEQEKAFGEKVCGLDFTV